MEHMEMKISQPIFGILVVLMKNELMKICNEPGISYKTLVNFKVFLFIAKLFVNCIYGQFRFNLGSNDRNNKLSLRLVDLYHLIKCILAFWSLIRLDEINFWIIFLLCFLELFLPSHLLSILWALNCYKNTSILQFVN